MATKRPILDYDLEIYHKEFVWPRFKSFIRLKSQVAVYVFVVYTVSKQSEL